MKKLLTVFSVLTAAAALAATVDSVTLSQTRGGDGKVTIAYVLADATEPQDITVALLREGRPVEIPEPASDWLSGELRGVTGNGRHTIALDPSFFPDDYVIGLQADVTCTKQSSEDAEVLYKIFDLANATVTDVTRGDLLSGSYGAYETSYSAIDPDFVSTEPKQLIWTGVTNDVAYKTTKLVMRRIPAGSFCMRQPLVSSTPSENAVTFAHDYYLSVFEMTKGQLQAIGCLDSVDAEASVMPAGGLTTAKLYISSTETGTCKDRSLIDPATTKATDTAVLKRLQYLFREKGQSIPFDLPTQAQWQRAFYAGATSVFYDGASTTATTAFAQRLGRLAGNADGAPAPVGSYLPNAWGLYDMLGNLKEWTCDVYESGADEDKIAAGGENLTGYRANELSYGRTGTLGADYTISAASNYHCAGLGVKNGSNGKGTEQGKVSGAHIGFRVGYYDLTSGTED